MQRTKLRNSSFNYKQKKKPLAFVLYVKIVPMKTTCARNLYEKKKSATLHCSTYSQQSVL